MGWVCLRKSLPLGPVGRTVPSAERSGEFATSRSATRIYNRFMLHHATDLSLYERLSWQMCKFLCIHIP